MGIAVELSLRPELLPSRTPRRSYRDARTDLVVVDQIHWEQFPDESFEATQRRAILDRADLPDVVVALDEAMLHRLIGSPLLMHDALVYVAEPSQRPYIVVQVVQASNGANAGLGSAFDIATADGMPETLRMEGVEDQTLEKRSLVRKAAVAFDGVRGDALPRDASRALILKSNPPDGADSSLT